MKLFCVAVTVGYLLFVCAREWDCEAKARGLMTQGREGGDDGEKATFDFREAFARNR